MKHRWHLPIAAALFGLAVPAGATIVYSNNFDQENNGVGAPDYTGFAGLTVSYPFVDLIHNGDDGVSCVGGSGGCVDLDGGLSGQLISTAHYAFAAGQMVTLGFAISGSQRAASPLDATSFFFRFDQPTSGTARFASTGGIDVSTTFDADANPFVPGAYDLYDPGVIAPYDRGFETVAFSFVADNGGTVRFVFDDYTPGAGDYDDDDAGRVIDNVALDISSVPEPGTWATTILGMGGIGAAARHRRRRALAAA